MARRSAPGKHLLAALMLGGVVGAWLGSAAPASAGQTTVKYEYDSRGRIVHRSSCVARTCAEQGKTCGKTSDGCGHDLQCGTCPAGSTCTTDNSCCAGNPCALAGAACGVVSNGCGGKTECGTCTDGAVCTASNVCCAPKSCDVLGKNCGIVADECGGTVHCGDCPDGDRCLSTNLCCTPKTCADLGKDCGTVEDGCGGVVACGDCGPGHYCEANVCGLSYDVGVLLGSPATLCPPGMGRERGQNGDAPIEIYMDDEDTTIGSNDNNNSGWIGGISQDYQGTRFRFCRVPGRAFKPLATQSLAANHYAVLKLGYACPPGSEEFMRFVDNEDDGNKNSALGNIYPNVSNRNTTLYFCLFRGATTATPTTMEAFPDFGFEYGIFAAPTFAKALESGWVYTDDEDSSTFSSNTNDQYPKSPSDVYVDSDPIIHIDSNTMFRIAKAVPPPNPIALTATPTGMVVELTWTNNATSKITGFDVERSTLTTGWTRIGSTAGPTATAFTDGSVTAGKAYIYRIKAYTASGLVWYSREAYATALKDVDVAPTMLVALPVGMALKVKWQNNAGATPTGFHLERKTGSSGVWAQIATIADPAPHMAYVDGAVQPFTTYWYRVRAYHSGGRLTPWSNESSESQSTTSVPTLQTPVATGMVIDLTWANNAGATADGFKIERKTETNGTWAQIATVTPSTTVTYRDLSVNPSLTYYYRIRAYTTSGGNTDYSREEAKGNQDLASAPSLTVTPSGMVLDLAWVNKAGDVPTGFKIERKTGSTGTWTQVATTSGLTATTYRDGTVYSGTTYYYRVRAYTSAGGNTAYSTEASGVQLASSSPSGLTATATGMVIDLRWVNNAPTADEFWVERKIGSTGSWVTLGNSWPATNVLFRDGTVGPSTTYFYRVRAVMNAGARTGYSNEVSAVQSAASAPSALTVTVPGSSTLDLVWVNNASDTATGFQIERRTGATGTWAQIATVTPATTVSYRDSGVAAGTYAYRVRAYTTVGGARGGGTSAYSNEASGVAWACTAPTVACGSSCVNTTSDRSNCGSCGVVCPAGPANSLPTCSASACSWTCNSPYTKCGTSCVNTATNASNCGGCGIVCESGRCSAGSCLPEPTCTPPKQYCYPGCYVTCP